ncbi:MAG TPA: hypothetical protein VNP92_07225 [Actinophytocola sp.]|nr:hypothetical protein [Actinophytocola sp.]
MEAWRVVATVLLAAAGLVLVLLTMAKTRDRKDATSGQVAIAGAITFTVLLVLCVLTLTVLTAPLVWGVVGVVVVVVSVMLLAS